MQGIGQDRPVVVIGGGLAGLFAALKLAPLPVTVITPRPLGEGASSTWAQGGIAAAIGEGDSFDLHAVDTIRAGAGLCDETMVRMIVGEAATCIEDLLRHGVPFERDAAGRLRQSQEAAHSARRVVSIHGDRTGREIMTALIAGIREIPRISIIEEAVGIDLAVEDGRVVGLFYTASTPQTAEAHYIPARAVVLATGGIGQLYALTTNPREARGDGLAMAARVGAVIADAEFVQFHPTAIDVGKAPAPLATEALRGEGAVLVNGLGERFMLNVHADAELAPRDVVARAVQIERASGRGAYLDCTQAIGEHMAARFPTVNAACREAGIDPAREPFPVAPAAHYHMGGVATGLDARTSVPGLWAIGEVASTGLHGANRLASNSLLEAVVMATHAANDILGLEAGGATSQRPVAPDFSLAVDTALLSELQRVMTANVGVVRSGEALREALAVIERIAAAVPAYSPLGNMAVAARFVTVAALVREESRGSHYRTDFLASEATARRGFATHNAVRAIANETLGWM